MDGTFLGILKPTGTYQPHRLWAGDTHDHIADSPVYQPMTHGNTAIVK